MERLRQSWCRGSTEYRIAARWNSETYGRGHIRDLLSYPRSLARCVLKPTSANLAATSSDVIRSRVNENCCRVTARNQISSPPSSSTRRQPFLLSNVFSNRTARHDGRGSRVPASDGGGGSI